MPPSDPKRAAPVKDALTDALKDAARTMRDAARLGQGAAQFALSRATPEFAHQALIALHCKTRGASNDALHALVAARHRPLAPVDAHGILGDAHDVDDAVRALDRDGCYVFPRRLDDAWCDRLIAFASSTPARPTPRREGNPDLAVYDRAHPLSYLYRFREADLWNEPAVQELCADESVLLLGQRYLGCEPVLDLVAMWWSAVFASAPDAESAQLFHFDMDRIKWLKLFVYLTDVDEESGPHVYVRGSHRRFDPPRALLRKGYARLDDGEVAAHYGARITPIVGPRGTIFAADTRGFHRGIVPRRAHRLMFELELCDSLFGARLAPVDVVAGDALRALARAHPRVTSRVRLL